MRMRLLPLSAINRVPLAATAIPEGPLNEAPVPMPSANAAAPLPAYVTTPVGVTRRMRLLPESEIYMLPLESTAMPLGLLKAAPVPAPSLNAAAPPPASVLTVPPGVTFRTRLLDVSATNTLPAASTATANGVLNEAAVPVLSAKAGDPLPASVLTTPPGDTLRTRCPKSTTYTVPPASTATPRGSVNNAPVPAPSANPAVPLPASVLTSPPGVNFRMRWFPKSATKTLPAGSTATE